MSSPAGNPRRKSAHPGPALSPVQQRLYGDVAKKLRIARRQSGLETETIAREVSRLLHATVTRSTMRRAFEGSAHLTLDKLWAASRVLGVPLASLLPAVVVEESEAAE